MFYKMIEAKRNEWLASNNCTIKGVIDYIEKIGQMGHSDAGITMNVYTHSSYDTVRESMEKVLQFQRQDMAQKSG